LKVALNTINLTLGCYEGGYRYYRQYHSNSDRTSCYLWKCKPISSKLMILFSSSNVIMYLTSHWPIIFSIRVSPLILTISLREITGMMSKLPMNIYKQIYKLRKNISLNNSQMNLIKWIHTEGRTWVVDSLEFLELK